MQSFECISMEFSRCYLFLNVGEYEMICSNILATTLRYYDRLRKLGTEA